MLSWGKRVREAVTPARKTSAFLTRGVLTPDEFVAAGEQLVFKCPTWSWESGDPAKTKDCLPDKSKQFLVTRNVPCFRRASTLEGDYFGDTEVRIDGDSSESGTQDDEAWLEPNVVQDPTKLEGVHGNRGDGCDDEELELGSDGIQGGGNVNTTTDGVMKASAGLDAIQLDETHFSAGASQESQDSCQGANQDLRNSESRDSRGREDVSVQDVVTDDDCPDLDSFVEDNLMQGDEATVQAGPSYMTAQEPEDSILPTRSYDLSITYDKHYQTPRIWLFGYDETGQPLTPEQVFEDVMQDYAKQTVTMEPHPHLSSYHASVHPCKHADTMKIMLANLTKGGKEARVDQYLFIFLKFIQSVVPTINYDYTMSVDAGGGSSSNNPHDGFVGVEAAPDP